MRTSVGRVGGARHGHQQATRRPRIAPPGKASRRRPPDRADRVVRHRSASGTTRVVVLVADAGYDANAVHPDRVRALVGQGERKAALARRSGLALAPFAHRPAPSARRCCTAGDRRARVLRRERYRPGVRSARGVRSVASGREAAPPGLAERSISSGGPPQPSGDHARVGAVPRSGVAPIASIAARVACSPSSASLLAIVRAGHRSRRIDVRRLRCTTAVSGSRVLPVTRQTIELPRRAGDHASWEKFRPTTRK
jgi:hypothetical protein